MGPSVYGAFPGNSHGGYLIETIVPTIHTAHLSLIPLKPEDAETLAQIYQTEGVLRYFPNPIPPSLENVRRNINNQQAHWEKFGYGNWGILTDGQTEIGGWAGLQYLPELGEIEVGFLLNQPFWGKGYATEAAFASLHFGFEQLKMEHIIALVHPENIASRKVIEKCGMRYMETVHLWSIDLRRYCLKRP